MSPDECIEKIKELHHKFIEQKYPVGFVFKDDCLDFLRDLENELEDFINTVRFYMDPESEEEFI